MTPYTGVFFFAGGILVSTPIFNTFAMKHPVEGRVVTMKDYFAGDAKTCLLYTSKKPHLLISHTTKGKGVSYMEGLAKWHHGVPTAEQYEEAVREISERIEKLEKENNCK